MSDPNGLIQPGRPAPGFTLPATPDGGPIGPEQFRGQPVVLAFYPADWSPVCGDQMSLYQSAAPVFAQYKAVVLGVSVDSIWSTGRSRRAGVSSFHYWPTSSRRVRSPAATARTTRRVRRTARWWCSTRRAR